MRGFSDRFLLLSPIHDGWAVVGRTDKYLSPAAVEVVSRTSRVLELRMVESGPLAVWTSAGAVSSKEAKVHRADGGLWTLDPPPGKSNFVLHIERLNE